MKRIWTQFLALSFLINSISLSGFAAEKSAVDLPKLWRTYRSEVARLDQVKSDKANYLAYVQSLNLVKEQLADLDTAIDTQQNFMRQSQGHANPEQTQKLEKSLNALLEQRDQHQQARLQLLRFVHDDKSRTSADIRDFDNQIRAIEDSLRRQKANLVLQDPSFDKLTSILERKQEVARTKADIENLQNKIREIKESSQTKQAIAYLITIGAFVYTFAGGVFKDTTSGKAGLAIPFAAFIGAISFGVYTSVEEKDLVEKIQKQLEQKRAAASRDIKTLSGLFDSYEALLGLQN